MGGTTIGLIVLGACASIAGATAAQPPLRLVRVASDTPSLLVAELHAEGFETDEGIVIGPDHVELVVSASEQAQLVARGLGVEVLDVGKPLRVRFGEIPDGYPDAAGVLAQMQAAVDRRPDIAQLVDLTDRYGVPPTHEGRHLYAVRISDNVAADEAEPAFLLVSAHHSREIGTPTIALTAIDRLVDGHGSDPRITAAVDANEIWIAPLWNPDGYEWVYNVDDYWRKNRRDNGDGSYGVDLNRNYPFGWGQCGGSSSTTSPVYQGPAPASEPETQTMVAFAADRRFAKVADIHSFASEVRYGYGCWDHPWDATFASIATDLSALSGYGGRTASSCCLGGDIHFHASSNGAVSFLWEIGDRFHPTFDSAQDEADTVWDAVIGFIDRPIPLSGRVTAAATGLPVEARVELVGVRFEHDERHRTAPRHGLYHAWAPPGGYTLRFTADGFVGQEHTVSVSGSGAPTVLDVALLPECPADLNGDGLADFFDFSTFVALFTAGDPAADLTRDGLLDFFDVSAFLAAFQAGCD